MKWEGNDKALQAFDNVLASSVRPALITPLAMHSPALSKPRKSGLTPGLGGVRIVGDMMFDPIQMRWFNMMDEGAEEELDFGDDEAENGDYFAATGKKADWTSAGDAMRMDAKASFGTSDGRQSTLGGSLAEDEFKAKCWEAETRHQQEVKLVPASQTEADDRSFLWSIRKVRSVSCFSTLMLTRGTDRDEQLIRSMTSQTYVLPCRLACITHLVICTAISNAFA